LSVAKCKQPRVIGEETILKPAMLDAWREVLYGGAENSIFTTPFSNDTVKCRVESSFYHIEIQLVAHFTEIEGVCISNRYINTYFSQYHSDTKRK
jgi:hypothetical protein